LLLGVGLLLALLIAFFVWLWISWNSVERIDLSGVLDEQSGEVTNYLLVGSDSRSNLDPDAPGAAEPSVQGSRADTIILLSTSDEQTAMMSIPRDLWVTMSDTGEDGRINGAFNRGPEVLISTVKAALNVPIHHYAEVDFSSFAGVIDAVGGVTINFEHPASDPASGLNVTQTGDVTLTGARALSYVRSRNYTETIDGEEVTDPTADLGRQERQQQFLIAAFSEVSKTKNPTAIGRVAAAVSEGLVVDTGFGLLDAISLARHLGGSAPETVVLPTSGERMGGASVLVMIQPDADLVLGRFR
jgi:LCP family protein required for cell wall assembly